MSMTNTKQTTERVAVILAAGRGVRMQSDLPKVLLPLAGKAMLLHVIEKLVAAGLQRLIFIVGYRKEAVLELLPTIEGVRMETVEQTEQKGTAHALACAADLLGEQTGSVLVTCGDMPLIRSETFVRLMRFHDDEDNGATVLSSSMDKPNGYGRLVRNAAGELLRIVEEKDADDLTKKIQEVNSGTYIFKSPEIFKTLNEIGCDNAQQEYYLPDAISTFREQGFAVGSVLADNAWETAGANSKQDLAQLEEKLKLLSNTNKASSI